MTQRRLRVSVPWAAKLSFWPNGDGLDLKPMRAAAPLVWTAAFLIFLAVLASMWMGHLGSTRVQYFPKSFLEDVWTPGKPLAGQTGPVIVDAFEEDWYPTYWRAAGEPSLYLASRTAGSPYAHTVRFTWLRSFHAPVIVRLDTLPDGRLQMTATRLAGVGGQEIDQPFARKVRDLSTQEQASFEAMLASTAILGQAPIDLSDGGVDGAVWIVEGSAAGEYRYINRWSPDPEWHPAAAPMRDAGLFMLGLTGWDLDPIY